ncbi:cysteine-rich VLP protein [Paenibacillus thailandensis]|uniref:Cysteine-rich VLP protein n=1 Tax=Paenibacillus thailandensis TaxID=393250 RepID=A0ABW5QYU8_9BACL
MNRLQSLAKRQCATFDTSTEDRCLLDCQCVFFGQSGGRCRYFEEGVLPTDPKLERAYRIERGLADGKEDVCRKCSSPFERKSNRQIYCTGCGVEAARKARNKRARKYRESNALNGGK